MRVAFVLYNFIDEKLPLQPWLTIARVAAGLADRGHEIHLVTDTPHPATPAYATVHSVSSLRGSAAGEVNRLLAGIGPDALVCLPTPLNLVTASWLGRARCRRVGFASYPFYNRRELVTAARLLRRADSGAYLRHLLVPRPLWVWAMNRRLDALVAQSETTAARLAACCGSAVRSVCIPPGINHEEWPVRAQYADEPGQPVRLLYLGSAIAIRGFDLALDALARIRELPVRLRVLARAADAAALDAVRAAVERRNLMSLVEVEGGWTERARLVREIHAADAVLQPFVLVPSELPVTCMEVIACGTPVIGSAIDGLPSTIGTAGTVTPQGDAAALAGAIAEFVQAPALRAHWRAGCLSQRAAMPGWEQVISRWEAVLDG